MTETKFYTDSTADLTQEYILKRDVGIIGMTYTIGDKEYTYSEGSYELSGQTSHEFYDAMRAGATPTTALINTITYFETFEPTVREGRDVFYIAFSSGLSGSCNNAMAAAKELEEKYPGRRVRVVDSLSASLGEGLVAYLGIEKHFEGASDDEVEAYIVDEVRDYAHHWFTVDDLVYLKRGGRVSSAAAIIGGMLNIKPVLDVSIDGRLIPREKVQGRKRALKSLVDQMEANIEAGYAGPVFLSHGDCHDDAQIVAKMIRQRFGLEIDMYNMITPIIGAHSGPGTVALFYMAKNKKQP